MNLPAERSPICVATGTSDEAVARYQFLLDLDPFQNLEFLRLHVPSGDSLTSCHEASYYGTRTASRVVLDCRCQWVGAALRKTDARTLRCLLDRLFAAQTW